MNNLKRVLSLGLVGAMLSGMMIMGASASMDYTDVDDITNVEAVEAMGSLNIINGKDDGSFDPEGFVTRAEMAKMIAVAMNGGKEPNFGVKANPSYTDIKGHWAETFIEYCRDLEIISGRGDGTFDPAGNVTGVEAAKMVLSALGYDATAYQLVGANWNVNVNREATQTCDPSLYESLENVTMAQAITRDVAAQIIWNGLQNETMTKTPDKSVTSGEVTYTYEGSNKNFLEVHYGAKIGYGKLEGNHWTDNSIPEGQIRISGFYTDNVTPGTSHMFVWDTDLANIGEEVKVIFKDGVNGTKERPDRNDTIYGVFNTGKTQVLHATKADVAETKNDKVVLKIAGTTYNVNAGVEVVNNYNVAVPTTYTAAQLKGNASEGSQLNKDLKAANGDAIKVIFNDDNEIVKIYVLSSKLAVVTGVSSDKVSISGVGSLDKDDNEIYEDVAKDDVVVVTTLYKPSDATDDNAYTIVEKAEVVEGELTKWKTNESVTVDGETYKLYHNNYLNSKDTATVVGGETTYHFDFVTTNISKSESKVDDDLVGKDVALYLVNGFVAAIKRTSEDASNYSVIIDVVTSGTVGSALDGVKIRVLGADGTKTTLTLADDSKMEDGLGGTKTIAGTSDATHVAWNTVLKKGAIVTYDVNKDGEATVTVKCGGLRSGITAAYKKDAKTVEDGTNTYVTAADCVLFISTSATGDYKAYNIRDLGNIDLASATDNFSWVWDKDNKVVAVFMDTKTGVAGAGSKRVYGIVTAYNGGVRLDGTAYRQYTISVNGEDYVVNQKATAWEAASSATNQLKKGAVVTFEPTSDGYYENANDFILVKNDAAFDGNLVWSSYVKEYDADAGIITLYTGTQAKKADGTNAGVGDTVAYYEGTGSFTYAVDDDVKMFYVDTDNDKGFESGSVNTFDQLSAKRNVSLVIEQTTQKVVVIVAEVSNEEHVDKW